MMSQNRVSLSIVSRFPSPLIFGAMPEKKTINAFPNTPCLPARKEGILRTWPFLFKSRMNIPSHTATPLSESLSITPSSWTYFHTLYLPLCSVWHLQPLICTTYHLIRSLWQPIHTLPLHPIPSRPQPTTPCHQRSALHFCVLPRR